MAASSNLFSREIFTPTSLAVRIQDSFDRDFGHIWVEGEISELSLPRSGHAYFTIKDRDARLKAVMWKGRRPYAGSALAEGMSVLAKGRLAIYAPRGDFQLVTDYLEPRGEGALRLAFEKLKAALSADGLFNEERKRPLPFWPSRVAVISSASGAAVRDFIHTALKLRPGAAISLYPVRVQGEGAAGEIAEAIGDLNAWGGFDLIVLTRGGGSLSDLWAFNEEIAVRAVAASRIVTLAAIGHSTDLSLCELAADNRAITPTAAAEAVFRDQKALLNYLDETDKRLIRAATLILNRGGDKAADMERRLNYGILNLVERDQRDLRNLYYRLGRFEDRLALTGQKLNELNRRLSSASASMLSNQRERLNNAEAALRLLTPQPRIGELSRRLENLKQQTLKSAGRRLDWESRRLAALRVRLEDLSPTGILKRGYALVSKKDDGSIVMRAEELSPGQEVEVRLAEGGFSSLVQRIITPAIK